MFFKDHGIVSPEEGLMLEERIFREREPCLILYTRDRPTVSLGRFNEIGEYVDTLFTGKNNIAIVRRMSGGSAIYSDQDQLVFTVITNRSSFADKMDSYKVICNCLVDTLAHLGIKAEYKPRNDVLVDGMKISGCAQYRDRKTLLHHGTLILKLNDRMMDGSLKMVKERKYPRLTSVEESLGYVPDRKIIAEAFEKGFSGLR